MTEKGCDNCYYSYFDERAYPCSLCIRGIERTDMWQPSKKTKADRKTEPQKKCHRDEEYACHLYPNEGACNNCKLWYEDKPQTEDLQDWKDRMWAEAVIEPQENTHDIRTETHECVKDTHDKVETMSCQECKWWFTDSLKHGGYCQSLLYNHECRYEPEVDCSWK